ncbi:unnamed protein product [Effrenium voratum]|nr:unnamed protein product [Effrenium voratum]
MTEADVLDDERVQYHARRFREKQAEVVLQRYETQRGEMSKAQLEKHALHVASWLLTLPAEETTREHNGLSVVGVLLRYLESLENQPDGQPLCERLVRILTAVSQYAGRFLGEGPAAAEGCSLGREPRTSDREQLEAKAVRLMQGAIQTWKNSEPTSRETYVKDLELEVEESADPATLRRILRRAVAALSSPRCQGHGMPQCSPSQSELPACPDLQVRLRKIVLCCLDVMDLTDSLVQPSLQCLQIHLQKFQELLESASSVASKKQWLRLQAKCVGGNPQEVCAELPVAMSRKGHSNLMCAAVSKGGKSQKRRRCEHGELRYCRICAGCPHGKVKQCCEKCKPCPHGKLRQNCHRCCPCPHGKVRRSCVHCCGCPHGKRKHDCRKCSSCQHGKAKRSCILCSACAHGKLRRKCRQCIVPRSGLRGLAVQAGPEDQISRA